MKDALAVYYFPGMWEWNRDIVLPLTHQALEKGLTRQRDALAADAVVPEHFEADLVEGRTILDRYLAWAPSIDRFWPVRVETDFDVALPDLSNPGHDLVSESGDPIRYEGRVDLLVVDEHDAYWVVRHQLSPSGFADPDLLALDDESTAACWAWELFYLGMRIAGTIHDYGYLGDWTTYLVEIAPGRTIRAARANATRALDRPLGCGDAVWLTFAPSSAVTVSSPMS